MKQLIEYIVSNIVNHPENVIITEEKEEGGDLSKYLIKVDPEDVGRVIGKQGKVIKSIRQIVRIAAIQKGARAIVDLQEDDADKENTNTDIIPEPVNPETNTSEEKETKD